MRLYTGCAVCFSLETMGVTESEYTCVTSVVNGLKKVSIQDTPITKGEAFWSVAIASYAGACPPDTVINVSRQVTVMEVLKENFPVIRIDNSYKFDALTSVDCRAPFVLDLVYYGHPEPLTVVSHKSCTDWVPFEPIPLRDVETIVITLKAPQSTVCKEQRINIGMMKVLDPVASAKFANADLFVTLDDGRQLRLPGHPKPYIALTPPSVKPLE